MISFIIIGKNEGWKLKACLDALSVVVCKDKIQDYEIIYVDSKSTDDSINVAKQYPKARVFLITGECNAGVGRNIGGKEAKGDILCFLDGDMELQTEVIPSLLDENNHLRYPFYSGLHLNRISIDHGTQIISEVLQKHPTNKEFFYTIATGGLMIIEREWWNKMQGIDTRFKYNEDYDFGLRMTEHGVKPCRQCKLWVIHNTYSHEASPSFVSSVRYTSVLYRKHWWNIEFLLKKLIPSQYTAIMLFFTLGTFVVGIILYPSFLWAFLWSAYAILLLRKVIKQKEIATIKMLWMVLKRDVVFLTSILFFWPKPIELKYEEK